MSTLPPNPTLHDFQVYVREMEEERGFSNQTVSDKCILLGEEIGELFRAIRKLEGVKLCEDATVTPASEELADIFIYLCAIANRYGIDLERAFREKEEINKKRVRV